MKTPRFKVWAPRFGNSKVQGLGFKVWKLHVSGSGFGSRSDPDPDPDPDPDLDPDPDPDPWGGSGSGSGSVIQIRIHGTDPDAVQGLGSKV